MYHNKLARRTENSKIWQKSKTTDENIFYSLYSLYQHTFKHKIVKKKVIKINHQQDLNPKQFIITHAPRTPNIF